MAEQRNTNAIKISAQISLGLFFLAAVAMTTSDLLTDTPRLDLWRRPIGFSLLAWGLTFLCICFISMRSTAISASVGQVLLSLAAIEIQAFALLGWPTLEGVVPTKYLNDHLATNLAMAGLLSAIYALTISLNSKGDWRPEYHVAVILTVCMTATFGVSKLVDAQAQETCKLLFGTSMFAWCGMVSFRFTHMRLE